MGADTATEWRGLPQAVEFAAADGYPLRGTLWRAASAARAEPAPVVVINPATSVCARYYARFAGYLQRSGCHVLSYDYRGIGESRRGSLRALDAGWIDWGRLDVDAALRFVRRALPASPVQVVGHSAGGVLVGLAPSADGVSRIFTVGAQYAYWRDYAAAQRGRMLLKWHLVMPLLTRLFGYFPGRRLGWLEDTPRGVVRDWTARQPRLEDTWRRGVRRLDATERARLVAGFAAIQAPTLALSLADDAFGTVAAVRRTLAYFRRSPRLHWHLDPATVGQRAIGHFAYFHDRFEHSLWPIARDWLVHGRPPAAWPGALAPLPAEG